MTTQLSSRIFCLCLIIQANEGNSYKECKLQSCIQNNSGAGQFCPQTSNGNGLPSFQDYSLSANQIPLHHQAIIPSYKFVCDQMCGNITEWGMDVNRGGGRDQMLYTLDLQVWRPSPTLNDSTSTGCYSLVGNNRFTSISLSDQVARVTPSPQDYIQF